MSNDAYFFISHCVEFHSDLLRDALSFIFALCPRISFQRGIPQFCCLTRPYLKLALGHHNDDIIHTALMNLFFHGSLSSMPPSKPLDKMPITIIRPLCLEHEEDIARHAASAAYQKQKKLCPYERDSHRSDIAHIYRTVETMSPEARFSIWHALGYDNATSTQSTPPLSPITPI